MIELYEKINELRTNNIDLVVVTAVEKEGEGPVEVGKKLIVTETELYGTVGGGALENYAINQARKLIKERKHLFEKYYLNQGEIIDYAKTLPMVCGGIVTLFYEYVGFKNIVYIFGAGHVGQALAKVLKPLSFQTIVIDPRDKIIEGFIDANQKHHLSFVDFIIKYGIKDQSFVVVCTPSHTHDYHVLHHIIKEKYQPKYIGMLCSIAKLKDYLDQTKKTFKDQIDLSNFYSPIGLDLGGGSPEEIAISIASEILAIHHDKKEIKHLREQHGKNRYW
jgi:xanthine dehydrogenase accessory factor